LNRIVKIMKIL